jgi:hypothetical protein
LRTDLIIIPTMKPSTNGTTAATMKVIVKTGR